VDSDTNIVTSAYFENLAVAMLEWLRTKYAEPEEGDEGIFECVRRRRSAPQWDTRRWPPDKLFGNFAAIL